MTIELRVTTDVRESEKVIEFEPVFFGSERPDTILDQVKKLMKMTKWHKIEIIDLDYKKK